MKEPFRPGRLQAGLGARSRRPPSGEPALLVRSEAPFRQLRRSRAGLSHDQRCQTGARKFRAEGLSLRPSPLTLGFGRAVVAASGPVRPEFEPADAQFGAKVRRRAGRCRRSGAGDTVPGPLARPPAQGPSCPAPCPAPPPCPAANCRGPSLPRRTAFEWGSALLVQCVT